MLGIAGALAFGAIGCSNGVGGSTGDTGTVTGTLRLSDGLTVDSVHYHVDVKVGRGSRTIAEGDIPVAAPGAEASFFIADIPATDFAGIGMEATTTDGLFTCTGSTHFPVASGEVLTIALLLQCVPTAGRPAQASVTGTFNYCPYLTSVIAAPLTAAVGEAITLQAVAVDRDPGETVTYRWSSNFNRGTFADPAAATTTFTCATAGSDNLSILVVDAVHDCGDGTSFNITCVD